MHSLRRYGRVLDGRCQVIQPLELVGTIYMATPAEKAKAKRAVLQHDPDAIDILEILGLDNV
jgi:hypothetical protein